MDEVKLDGKVYIRSAAAAKQFGYTTDYMGQLSREGRIDAQMVGRSWYVYPPSVEAYQSSLETDEDPASEAAPSRTERRSQTRSVATERTLKVHADNRRYRVKTHETTTKTASRLGEMRSSARRDEQTAISASRDEENPSFTDRLQQHSVSTRYLADATELNPLPTVAISAADDHELSEATPDSPPTPTTPETASVIASPTAVDTNPVAASIQPAGPSRRLQVHTDSDKFSIVTPELPSIRLRGKVTLVAVDGEDEITSSPDEIVSKIKDFERQTPTTSATGRRLTVRPETVRSSPPRLRPLTESESVTPATVCEPGDRSATDSSQRRATARRPGSPGRYFWLLLVILLSVLVLAPFLEVVWSSDATQATGVSWQLRLVWPSPWWPW